MASARIMLQNLRFVRTKNFGLVTPLAESPSHLTTTLGHVLLIQT